MQALEQETQAQRQERLIVEARDLVADLAQRCQHCRKRMRYFPDRGQTVRRAAGRTNAWRCDACYFGSERLLAALEGRELSPVAIWQGLYRQTEVLWEHFEELRQEVASELFAEAIERLCMQLQEVMERIEALERAIERKTNLVLFEALFRRHEDSPYFSGPLSEAFAPA